MRKSLSDAITIALSMIGSYEFMIKSRVRPSDFSREGEQKLGFATMIKFALNFIRKSCQLELDSFLDLKDSDETVTKQAYSAARQKILPEAFINLNDAITSWFYGDDDFKTFHGYRISAIDGSVLEVPNTQRLRDVFGYVKNQHEEVARAMSSGIYDVLNDIMIVSKIGRYDIDERVYAMDLIDALKEKGLKNDLILFDRGYPSAKFIAYCEHSGIKYVMRTPNMFLKAINEAKEADQIVEIKVEGETIRVRVLRFMLDSGAEEILLTNVFTQSWGTKEFKELYFMRWGIEIKYDEEKNRLQVENFTGETEIAVKQDFYATIYLSNMVALAKAEANEIITERNENANLKYEYKVNTNILIGNLKDKLVLMLLEEDPNKRTEIFTKIMDKISRNAVPIRPGRSYERKKGLKSNKYHMNQKRCL